MLCGSFNLGAGYARLSGMKTLKRHARESWRRASCDGWRKNQNIAEPHQAVENLDKAAPEIATKHPEMPQSHNGKQAQSIQIKPLRRPGEVAPRLAMGMPLYRHESLCKTGRLQVDDGNKTPSPSFIARRTWMREPRRPNIQRMRQPSDNEDRGGRPLRNIPARNPRACDYLSTHRSQREARPGRYIFRLRNRHGNSQLPVAEELREHIRSNICQLYHACHHRSRQWSHI